MSITFVFRAILLSSFAFSGEESLAVSPCITGPNVKVEVGRSVTEVVADALSQLPGVRILDRTLTASVVKEQDLLLVSRAADILPARFSDLGAGTAMFVSLNQTASGYLAGFRLIELTSGNVLGSAVYQVPAEKKLLAECGGWAAEVWNQSRNPQAAPAETAELVRTVNILWEQLDDKRVVNWLGPAFDRARSVYRQFREAAERKNLAEVQRLSHVASLYLLDCIALVDRIQNPPEGMTYVSPGWTIMTGSSGRRRRIWVDGFFIDRFEFTRGLYAALFEKLDRPAPLGWSEPTPSTSRLPVTGVNWADADAVANARGMSLASYPQWLRAVMGELEQQYPWGDDWRAECCAHAQVPGKCVLPHVGSHAKGASAFGVHDGAGSVFEWLDTWHDPLYWDKAPERNPKGPRRGASRLVVGGSFRSGPQGCACKSYEALTPDTRRDDVGFRCVLPLRSESARED